MIKFFRHIRKDLLEKNKTGKYLKYAIGEIILVVIGILIALQLNITREKKDLRKIELVHLNNILQDLNKEVKGLDWMITFKKSQAKASDTLRDYIDGKRQDDLVSFNQNQFKAFIWRVYHPNNNSFSELKSSGQLSLINSNDIRQHLLNLDAKYLQLSMMEEHLKFEYHEFLYKKNIEFVDYELMFNSRRKTDFDKNDSILIKENLKMIKGNKSLRNTYVLASSNNRYIASICAQILDIVKETIVLIEEDLEK